MSRYLRALRAAPGLWLLLCLGLTLACASGLPRLSFSTDYQQYFSNENPELQAQLELERHFGKSDTVVMAVVPADGEIFTQPVMDAIRDLTAQARELPYATDSASLTTFYTPLEEADSIGSEPLVPEGVLEPAQWRRIRERALDEPRIVHGLIAADGAVAAVIAYFDLPHVQPGVEIPAVNTAVRELQDRFEQAHPQLRLRLIGSLPFNQAMADAAGYDARHLYPLSFLLMLALLAFSLRGLNPTLGTLAVIVMAMLTALGVAGHLGLKLTTASAAAPLIILTLAISDCVHVFATYFKSRKLGMDSGEALEDSLRTNLPGVFLTSLTTVIGFLSFNTNDSPPFRDLGNIVAIGVAAAWLYSMLFLPAWILISRPQARSLRTVSLDGFAEWVIRHQRRLRIGTLGVAVALAACIPLNHFGDDYVKFFGPQIEFRQDTEFVGRHLMGVQYLEYAIPAGEEGGVNEPAYLQHLEAFATWLRAQRGVRRVSTLNELHKRLNQTMQGGDPAQYRLPDSRELAAQYLLLFELSLPGGLDLSHLVNFDKSVTRLTVGLNDMSNEDIRLLDERARTWMQTHWPAQMHTTGAGVPILFARIAQRNFHSMLLGNLITFLLVSLIFIAAMRSWRLGLLSLVPNFAPMLAGFGLWGLLVGEVGMSLAVVVSLTLGIVVDDSIHFLARYTQGRRQLGLSPPDAVRHAYQDVGAALWITTAVLTAGFGILALSSFQLTAYLGLLTTFIIVLALAADFFLLPALLLWLDRSRS